MLRSRSCSNARGRCAFEVLVAPSTNDFGATAVCGEAVGAEADRAIRGEPVTNGVAGQRDVDVEAGVGERGLQQGAGGADGLVELAGDAAALFHGAEGGEAFDALGAALLDAFDFVDLVADEFEEAGHDLA